MKSFFIFQLLMIIFINQNNFIQMTRLQSEKTRYFQYMRPRYANPTFSSDNMGASLFPLPSASHYLSQPTLRHKSQLKIVNPQSLRTQVVKIQKKQQSVRTPSRQNSIHSRKSSNLSNYGSSSLGKLPKYNSAQIYSYGPGNEVEIYEKQAKKYNIITLQPKSYPETIKKYPKYHLQNIDQNFYKKLMLEDQYRTMFKGSKSDIYSGNVPPQKSKNDPAPKYYRDKSEGLQKDFRPKMLNNIDQLGGVM